MNILTLDVETTTYNKGHWADKRNKLVMVGHKTLDDQSISTCYTKFDKQTIHILQTIINDSDILVGFNIKFDLHWLCNIGIDIKTIKRVWDTQIAEFLLEAQRNPYNSLNDALTKYGYPLKLDVVKTEYWDKNINTDEIPTPVLQEYLQYDLIGTENVFKEQYHKFTGVHL